VCGGDERLAHDGVELLEAELAELLEQRAVDRLR
jgi:hypothetical protein